DTDKAIKLAKQGMEKNPNNMGIHLLLARMYEKVGDTKGTVDLLKKMIAIQPDNQTNRNRLAAYYYSKGDKAEAEKVLRDAIAAQPESVDAKLSLVEFMGRDKSTRSQAEQELKAFVQKAPQQYQLQFALAKLYLGTGRREEAQKIYQNISDNDQNGVDGDKARTKLAGLLMMDNKLDQAKKMIDGVLADDPKNADALLTRAAISLATKDADKGIADLRTLLNEDPGNVKALRLKARAHLAKKEVALARESLEAAIQVSPQEAAANFELAQLLIQTGQEDDAIQVLEKMQKFAPDHLGIMLGLAKIYTRQKKWDEVASTAKQMQQKHPDSALGYYYAGIALQAKGEMEASVPMFESALKISPNAVEPLIAVARSWFALKQPDKALERVQQAIAHNKDNFLAYNLEGEIQISQKRLDKAEAAFNKAREINPRWPVPYSNLAKIGLIERNIPKALSILEQGYNNTKDLSLAVELASLYDSSGDVAKAQAMYEQLLKDRPNAEVVKNNLAMLLLNGNPDQATLDRALDLTKELAISENPIYLDTLGWVHYMRAEYTQAAKVLERADSGNLKLPDISYHLGMAYYKLGRKQDAMHNLEESLQSQRPFPGREQATEVLQQLKAE
ncbi:MAG: tetratricopeptide repeat protein, partial [Gammaproteobacteria bacterium]